MSSRMPGSIGAGKRVNRDNAPEGMHPKEHTRENGTELDKKGYVIVTIEKKGNANDSNIEVPRRKTEDC